MDATKLKFFKDILTERKKVIFEELGENTKELQGLYNSEPNDNVDFSTITTSSQIEQTINKNLKMELGDIERSLKKIQNRIYGICELCDDEINVERLKIKPHARYCVACRQSVELGADDED